MFEIQVAKGAKPSGGTLVSAFPSVGMVGSIAGSFIAESLKMERIAYVLSDDVPPAALVQDGIPGYPLRILGYKNLSIVASEFQIPLSVSSQLAKTLLEWSGSNGYDLVLCLEGLMSGQEAEPTKEVRVFGVGSTQHARDLVSAAGIEQFKIGMITGVSGALLSEGERLAKHVICLLVEANAMYPDARGGAKLVESVTKLLPNVQVDLKELRKEAEMIEENVKATVEKTKEMLAARQSQAERLGKSYMYG
ncbi:MAG: PAC2 family protein [Thermoplasmatota archaeon]|nr:PAC2 family protein [Candidatus Thermoplasmatota archaeon]MBU1914008.1 PAC2 family protein [Candidatus Thermoplasmatota archaeon]